MRVLALDTTTLAGSVALVDDDRVMAEEAGDPTRPHAERLPSDLLTLLTRHGLTTAEIDLFAVASGPGSFTGLRIGIATMQGLAFVHRRPMAAVSALDALAQLGSRDLAPGGLVGVWMDARRHDVFSLLCRVEPFPLFTPDRLREIEGPLVGSPATVLARWAAFADSMPGSTPMAFIGDGATQFSELIQSHTPGAVIAGHPSLAGAIGRIAVAQAQSGGTVEPGNARALYVRRPDAEIERERRSAGLSPSPR